MTQVLGDNQGTEAPSPTVAPDMTGMLRAPVGELNLSDWGAFSLNS